MPISREFFKWILVVLILTTVSDSDAANYFFDKGARCEDTAERNGFSKELIKAGDFTLLAYSRVREPGKTLVVYIEGDGSSWETRSRLSKDPTPREDLVIKLAILDPSPNVVYLARPGQYTFIGASECDPSYWSDGRYSAEVVDSMNTAISSLKDKYKAGGVSLVGYSGGGAIAVLLAAGRNDVVALRTVAGNLDHAAVSGLHGVNPLASSLNPADFSGKISAIPQRHFAGEKDDVVPPSIARAFVKKEGDPDEGRVTVVSGATHTKGWEGRWPELLDLPVD